MKKLGLIGLILFLCFHYSAQCDPDPIYADSVFGIWPSPQENLISGEVNIEYSQVINFKIPDEKIDSDLISDDIPIDSVLIESIQLNNISNLPAGLFYSCNIGNCTWGPGSGCTEIFGVPTQAGLYQLSMELIISSIIEIPFIGLQSIDYPFTYTYSLNIESCNQVTNLSDVFCDSYTFNGEEISSPGIYSDTLIAFNGCDSVVNLNLDYGTFESVDNITACGSYTWLNGQTYSFDTNGPVYTVISQNSCDTTFTLDLTILEDDFSVVFTSNLNSGQTPLEVEFTNQTPNLNNYNFYWNFGDASMVQDNNEVLVHTYNSDGQWDVSLIAQNVTSGCSDTLTINELIHTSGGVPCSHQATISSSQFSACQGDSILLSCNSSNEFTYQWQLNGFPIFGENSASCYAHESGIYNVLISHDGCDVFSDDVEVLISTMPILDITSNLSSLPCEGGNAILSADESYYYYSWSSGGYQASEIINVSGWYYLLVQDSVGCEQSDSIFIPSSNPPDIDLTNQNLSCFGSGDGSASATATGGQSPYLYSWSNGMTSSTINNLSAGIYTVTVTDDNGCVGYNQIEVSQPEPIEIEATISGETCFGAMDGSIEVTTYGGIYPYIYIWTNGSFFASTEDINELIAGTYLLGIVDDNGCSMDTTLTVQESLGPQTSEISGLTQVDPSIIYQYSVSENTTSSFLWGIINGNLISGQGTNLVSVQWGSTGIGQVSVVETDENGCVGESVSLNVFGVSGIKIEEKNQVRVFPNPTSESIYISIDNYKGPIYIEIFDLIGNKIQDSNAPFINFNEYSSGIYFIKVNYNDKVGELKVIKR